MHTRGAFSTHGDAARRLVDRVDLVEMSSSVLGRALLPFPKPVRALDALHPPVTAALPPHIHLHRAGPWLLGGGRCS